MADSKITALTALTAADPANDMIPIVDVSDTPPASGNTKRISINNLLACSPSATLASATITGDLTVDTSTLKVDSANNRVGIVNASPAYPLDVTGIINSSQDIYALGGRLALYRSAGASYFDWATSQDLVWRQVNSVTGTGASTLMTLNTTGLGIGGSAASKLSITDTSPRINFVTTAGLDVTGYIYNAIDVGSGGKLVFGTKRNGNTALDALTIDSSQNVGIGVTPSAWGAGYKVIQGQIGGFALSNDNSSNNQFRLSSNAYFDTTDSRWEYYGSSTATAYEQRAGEHRFFNAISGSANTAIAFTQAMTLNATGDLIVNGTNSFAKISSYVTSSGTFQGALGATNGSNSDFVVRIKTSVSDVYNSVGSLTLSTGGGGGTERVRVKDTGQVRFVPLAADPAGAEAGDVYYNSVSNRLKYYNGTAWTLI